MAGGKCGTGLQPLPYLASSRYVCTAAQLAQVWAS